MKREEWEELVDRVVDDECSDEERRALNEAAERNPEIREARDAALRIRELMRSSARATVPPEFSERLRLAIERSDVWVEREAARPTPRSRRERRGGKRLVWTAATGAAISFAAVAFFALEQNVGPKNSPEVARVVKPEQNGGLDEIGKIANQNGAAETNAAPAALAEFPLETARPEAILPPRNAGKTPDALPLATSSGFYTRRVLDAQNARRVAEAFVRFCVGVGAKCQKIDGDFEFLVEKTTPKTRNEILAWLNEKASGIGPRSEKNNFEEKWTEDGENEIVVRVSFFVAAPEGGAAAE